MKVNGFILFIVYYADIIFEHSYKHNYWKDKIKDIIDIIMGSPLTIEFPVYDERSVKWVKELIDDLDDCWDEVARKL